MMDVIGFLLALLLQPSALAKIMCYSRDSWTHPSWTRNEKDSRRTFFWSWIFSSEILPFGGSDMDRPMG